MILRGGPADGAFIERDHRDVLEDVKISTEHRRRSETVSCDSAREELEEREDASLRRCK